MLQLATSSNLADSSPSDIQHESIFSIASELATEDRYSGSLSEKLAAWSLETHTGEKVTTQLLQILRSIPLEQLQTEVTRLPKDSRTLRKVNRNLKFNKNGVGNMYHRDIQALLEEKLNNYEEEIPDVLLAEFFVDGIPPNNSNYQLWPIILKIRNLNSLKPIFAACYGGRAKPDSNALLEPFIDQLVLLEKIPLKVKRRLIRFKLVKMKGDIPAIHQFLGLKGHGGYHCCRKCFIKGIYLRTSHKIIYKQRNLPKRNDKQFRENEKNAPEDKNALTVDEKLKLHNIEHTCMVKLTNFDLVNDVLIDPLHLLCFGEVKSCVSAWTGSKSSVKMKPAKIKAISETIKNLNGMFPSEFIRTSKPLEDLRHSKGTELKNFLLYIFPCIKDMLSPNVAQHFLKLYCAVVLMSHPKRFNKNLKVAKILFNEYFDDCETVYGAHHYTFNTHLLTHLADEKFERPLFEESNFEYENELYEYKKCVKFGQDPLKQVCNRVEELAKIKYKKTMKINYPILDNEIKSTVLTCRTFNKLIFKSFCLSTKDSDSYYLHLNGSICRFLYAKIVGRSLRIISEKLKEKEPLFLSPFNSEKIDVFKSNAQFETEYFEHDSTVIKTKLLRFTIESSDVYLPLLHTADLELDDEF